MPNKYKVVELGGSSRIYHLGLSFCVVTVDTEEIKAAFDNLLDAEEYAAKKNK